VFHPSVIDAIFDTRKTASAALREMDEEGRPFSAAEYLARWQRLDDEATGTTRRAPVRVVAYVGRAIEPAKTD
jgi:hypothetical protein